MIKRLIARMSEKVQSLTRRGRGKQAETTAAKAPETKPAAKATRGTPFVVSHKDHSIRKEHLLKGAYETCRQLQDEGFKAYIVGGAVRDLLLGIIPKDFDVATDATPEQVRSVFRRSRIIGRRFRLVHVMFGRDTIEVSTFRAHYQRESDEDATDAHGRLLSDNVFGTMEEDALRRDFTVNALFYDPIREEVWDFQQGLADLKARKLCMIGDPVTRYREDPVRMLRAVRLSAKLGFSIDTQTLAPIAEMRGLLRNVPQARLFEEILKLLLSGHSAKCIDRLRELDLHHGLLPLLDSALDDPQSAPFALAALRATDERLADDKTVNPAFILAALLWGQVQKQSAKYEAEGIKPVPALHDAIHEVLSHQRQTLAVPRRYDAIITEIFLMQPRFLVRRGGQPGRMLQQPRFRAAYDFFELRAKSGNADLEVAEWWESFQEAHESDRASLLLNDTGSPGKKKRRRGGRRRGKAAADGGAPPVDGQGAA
jgi:poly(A) polymerase